MSKNRKFKARLFGNNSLMPCRYCGDLLNFEQATVEHLVPQSLSGPNYRSNLDIACAPCNNGHENEYGR